MHEVMMLQKKARNFRRIASVILLQHDRVFFILAESVVRHQTFLSFYPLVLS
jgi:hypothetical protein